MLCLCGSGREADNCIIHVAQSVLLLPAYYSSTRPRRWSHVETEGLGPLGDISRSIELHEARFGDVLPELHNASELFIASDYSGQVSDKSSKYELFSFLIFPYSDGLQWHSERQAVRERWMPGRTMSYKGLHDKVKRRALPHFLEIADTIPGMLATIAVSKRHASLFDRTRLNMDAPDLQPYSHWSPVAFEKLFRITHFLSFLLAGVSREGQSFIWYSDDDDAAPNAGASDRSRTHEMGKIWTGILTNIVPHRVPRVTIGTKKDDEPTRSLADILALPDLACGAWCRLLSLVTAAEFIHGDAAVTNALSALPTHVLQLLSWFSGGSVPLHRLLLIIGDPSPDNELDYMVSVPQMLQHFKHTIDEQIAARTLL